MVKTVSAILPISNGNIDIEQWLTVLDAIYPEDGIELIRHACILLQLNSDPNASQQAFEMANCLLDIKLDYESVAAALIYNSNLSLEDIEEHLGKRVTQLVDGVIKMDAIDILQTHNNNARQIDTIREMLLTMVDDIRIVLIKLAERCCIMRALEFRGAKEQLRTAETTQLIYAPLASRLGVYPIKWELEDLAFRYLDTEKYQMLAKQMAAKRIERENYVKDFIKNLSGLLTVENVHYEISGRAKHIYSIYKKMQKKNLNYSEIYDAFAVRVLVDSIDDCYKVLSIVHNEWDHIPEEFDDYIATPKENGYSSIHTVIVGEHHKPIEVQVRTHKMHEENEVGGAAHWLYKEGSTQSAYDRKITWLRELLAWQKELVDASELPEHLKDNLMAERIFVFTPNNDLVSLPVDATPLDFAYRVHSEIGHRCRGAKVNDKIVQLTHKLQTGDRVEVLTGKVAQPSRDWLNPHAGYVVSPHAKTKIHSWFKRQEHENVYNQGRQLIEREFKKLGLHDIDLARIAKRFHLKAIDQLYAGVGSGDIRLDELLKAVDLELNPEVINYTIPIKTTKLDTQKSTEITVEGVGDLLTHIAGCCKPLPGDKILGYVTQGHGITIHRADCENIQQHIIDNDQRVFDVNWGKKASQAYPIDIQIEALDRQDLLHDITMVFSQAKINLLALNSKIDSKKHIAKITIKVAVPNIETLNQALTKINQLTNIYEVKRI